MQSYKVMLFGHRDLYRYNKLEENLYLVLKDLMREKPHLEIYVGRNGDFDIIASAVVKRVREELGNESSEMILVLPYKEKGIESYEGYYDRVMILDDLSGEYLKGRMIKRDRWILDLCDLSICYVEHERDVAFLALQYAKKLGKKNINLARDGKKTWATCF